MFNFYPLKWWVVHVRLFPWWFLHHVNLTHLLFIRLLDKSSFLVGWVLGVFLFMWSSLSVQYMSYMLVLYPTICLCVVVIWAFKADRLFPCWCWLKLAFNSCILNIVHLACGKVFGISSQFVSLHVLQIWNTLLLSAWLFLNCWVDLLKNDYLALCFFIRTGRSLLSKKIASLLGFQVEVYIMVGHCFKILVYDWNWL
jgi:hypothetical protein